jgi:hypothetical protein
MVKKSTDISTKRTIIFHLNSLSIKKTTTYEVRNPGPGLRQAQKCGRVKYINGIPTLPLLITGSQPTPLDNWIITHPS